MEFCKKCGCVLVEKDGKTSCARCGETTDTKFNLETSEKVSSKSKITVINEDSQEVHAITDAECPKCKNDKAYFWIQQTRASDEAPTRFFRCTKCKHTWREYR